MAEVAIDNDVLIKVACYRLLDEVAAAFGNGRQVAVLGAARFVARNQIARLLASPDRDRTQDIFDAFLATVEEIEPTGPELDLATTIEEVATERAVMLDPGESQLCAIVLNRGVSFLLTGDKRAIAGTEILKEQIPDLIGLSGKLICLEQLAGGLLCKLGFVEFRNRICSAPFADKALEICLGCRNKLAQRESAIEGLRSYVNDLRTHAGTVLYPRDVFEC